MKYKYVTTMTIRSQEDPKYWDLEEFFGACVRGEAEIVQHEIIEIVDVEELLASNAVTE